MEQKNITINNPNQAVFNSAPQPQPGRAPVAAPISPSPPVAPIKTENNPPQIPKPAGASVSVSTSTPSPLIKPPRKINLTFIFYIFLLLTNFILIILIILKLPTYEKLKNQAFLEKTYFQKGLTKGKLKEMNLIFTAFADEKTVVQMVSEINKAQYLFRNYSFSFESDIPKKEGASYLPFVIKVKGYKDTLFYLIDKLTSSKNVIEITDLQTGYNTLDPQKETESIINAKLYISENYSK